MGILSASSAPTSSSFSRLGVDPQSSCIRRCINLFWIRNMFCFAALRKHVRNVRYIIFRFMSFNLPIVRLVIIISFRFAREGALSCDSSSFSAFMCSPLRRC